VSLDSTVVARTHEEVVRMVYEGEVDAGFTYSNPPEEDGLPRDGRLRLAQRYPDVMEKLVVVATTDKIPNDPVVFSKNAPAEVQKKITEALLRCSADESCAASLVRMHEITGLKAVDDSYYEPIRKAILGLGKSIKESVPGGGLIDVRQVPAEPIPPIGF